MAKTCKSCGIVSETGEGYRPVSLMDPATEFCPACFPKKQTSGAWLGLLLFPAMFAFSWFMVRRHPEDLTHWFLLNLMLAGFFQAFLILPHELGHAMAARLLGVRVHQIVVGMGPRLFQVPLLGTVLNVHLYPLGGYTAITDPRTEGYRGRMCTAIAAGPLVNLLLVAAVSPWLPRPNPMTGFLHGWQPVIAFGLANAFILAFNLIPWKSAGDWVSDGRLLISIPFLSPEDIRKIAAGHYLMEGWQCIQRKRYEEAIQWSETGLREFPEEIHLRNNTGVAQLELGRFDQARAEFLAVAPSDKVDPGTRALAQNNVAVVNLLLERPELAEESDRMTTQAVHQIPWHPTLRVSRGFVLIVAGKTDEGLALVRDAMNRLEGVEHRAWAACAVALGLKAKGDLAEGGRYLDMAVKLNPKCLMLPQTLRAYGRPIPANPAN